MKQNLILIIVALFFSHLVGAQPWMKNVPQEKIAAGNYNFYDVQKAFNDYWADYNIVDGKFQDQNGEWVKAYGWKLFKRWEYNMQNRIDENGMPRMDIFWNEYKKINQTKGKDARFNWTSLGPHVVPNSPSTGRLRGVGRINCLTFHPTDEGTFWIGSPTGGVWKTTDSGTTWVCLTDDLPSGLGISDIGVNPNNPEELYLATGDAHGQNGGGGLNSHSCGILKTTDGGLTWHETGFVLSPTQQRTLARLYIFPQDPQTQIVTSSNGIFKTTDGWNTYAEVRSGNFIDIEAKPGNNSILYAAKYDGAAFYRSTDSGETWEMVNNGVPSTGCVRAELTVSPAAPNVVYALFAHTNSGLKGVYKSENSGESFVELTGEYPNLLCTDYFGGNTNEEGGQGWYDLAFTANPTNANMLFVGGINCWKSTNGGTSWSYSSRAYESYGGYAYVHADQHYLRYHPTNGKLYSCNDGGIYVSTNNGTAWTDISHGLTILEIYRLGTSATDNDRVITGAQDNGTFKFEDTDVLAVLGSDGMECMIDYTNANRLYATWYNGEQILRSVNAGTSWSNIPPSGATGGDWVIPFVMDPNNSNTLYAGYKKIYMSVNAGNSWVAISDDLGGTKKALAVAPSNSNYIYTSTASKVFLTTNGGSEWNQILLKGQITYIAVSPTDPNTAWVTRGGYVEGEKVYMTTDAGQTWINYSEGLPNVPVFSVACQSGGADNSLYLATDLGVYYRNQTLSKWMLFNNNMPLLKGSEIEIRHTTNEVVLASYGRGLWKAPLIIVSPPNAEDAYMCEGDAVPTLTASGTNVKWYANANLTELLVEGNTYQPTISEFGDVYFWITQTVNNEESTGFPVKLSYNPYPAAPTVTDLVNCHTASAGSLSAVGENVQWYADETLTNLVGEGTSYTPEVTEVGAHNYYVTQTVNGCASDAAMATYTIIDPMPQPVLEEICFGEAVPVLTAEGDLIAWYQDEALTQFIVTNFSYDTQQTEIGEYVYYITNIVNNCQSSPVTATLVIYGQPVAAFETAMNGFEVTITNQAENATAYLWNFGDGTTDESENPEPHTYDDVNVFTISQTVSNPACGSAQLDQTVQAAAVGFDEISSNNSLMIYPNPTDGQFKIRYVCEKTDDLQINIYNIEGQIVYSDKYTGISGEFEKIVDFSKYAKGIYNVEIIMNAKKVNQKLIVE